MSESWNTGHQNIAQDNAKVETQIGEVAGDAVFHRYETVYQINQADPPERKYQVALNHLHGDMARTAEELFSQVISAGHTANEVAYHYALAVLSERTLNQLGVAEFERFDLSLRVTARNPRDEWRVALDVIERLVACVLEQERVAEPDPDMFHEVLDRFRRLPPQRQEEITRHLDQILNGMVQDLLTAANAEIIRRGRTQGDREGRAWKFFQPDPAEPRLLVPWPVSIGFGQWAKAIVGTVLFVVGLVLAVDLISGNDGSLVLPAVLLVGGGLLSVRYGTRLDLLRARLATVEFRHGYRRHTALDIARDRDVAPRFARRISDLVEARFGDQRSESPAVWARDTVGIKDTLKSELIELYQDIDATPERVNWLIRWHAKRTFATWRQGNLFDFRTELRPTLTARALLGLGVLLTACGLLGMAYAMFLANRTNALGICVLLGLSGYHGGRAVRAIVLARGRFTSDRQEYERRLGEEQEAYRNWLGVLVNRPHDAEMARWLDYDKAHLKMLALKKYGLSNRDIIAHVALTEGAAKAMRARVLHGPVRYSAYVVLVFLLTDNGVREVEVDLDFFTGVVRDERRTSFRYDALSSARVTEVGVRFAGDRRYVVLVEDQMHVGDPRSSLVVSQAFRLSLMDGQNINVLVDNFDGLSDYGLENPAALLDLALDTSGVSGALRVLEAVAAEGREWIARERQRRNRRLREWHDNNRTPALGVATRLGLEVGGEHTSPRHHPPGQG
jgi:hypothetical protein